MNGRNGPKILAREEKAITREAAASVEASAADATTKTAGPS